MKSPYLVTAMMVTSLSAVALLGWWSWQTTLQTAPGNNQAAVNRQLNDPRLYAVGDIASCDSSRDEAVADLLRPTTGPIVLLGDVVYPRGRADLFRNCYEPAWGQFRDRTYPVPGNHEYEISGASGYYDYFGAAAHGPSGYYSFSVGAWHVIVLNSNCGEVGGCGPESEQGQWLAADLAANPARCTIAATHHPRFSSGLHGNNEFLSPLWAQLASSGVDILLSGHDHDYERFATQTADGSETITGLRQFVVGTGGRSLYGFRSRQPLSQVRRNDTYGALQLTLHEGGYSWQFLPVTGGSDVDQGSDTCR